ncbi:hypothetical protein [Paenibacillus sp. FSL E2-0201]|uniref:hypothetical protein n=1 Tax=unclassified Paenibacillus TaxID=185978 RepID=UPI0030D732F3
MMNQKYKARIQKRLRTKIVIAVIGGLAVIGTYIIKLLNTTADFASIDAYITGFFFGIEGVCVMNIIQLRKLLKDENALEEMVIYEEDERNQSIKLKGYNSTINLMIWLLSFGSIISSFFNQVIFFTLASVLVVLLVVSSLFRWFYTRN